MTTNDEWVRERAKEIYRDLHSGEPGPDEAEVGLFADALTDAIRRTRAEERANAEQALRLAHEMQDKAVAAERERLLTDYEAAFNRGLHEGNKQSIAQQKALLAAEAKLARLREPDEALTEAVGKKICGGRWRELSAEKKSYWRSQVWPICRALAATLSNSEPSDER